MKNCFQNELKTRIIKYYNQILKTQVPQQHKVSMVIPISKPETDKTKLESHRPICLYLCISKVVEKTIASSFWWFLENKNLLCRKQFDFKKDSSATFLDHHIYTILKNKKHATLIALDFEKPLIEWKNIR